MGSHRVSMVDVAREAGVSSMTVSRVVRGKKGVSAATRQRVQQVIERLGYRPSGIARGLATQKTDSLGLVMPDVANPFFPDVALGAEQEAYKRGYNVYLCNTEEDPEREATIIQSLEEKWIDGLLLISSRLDRDRLSAAVQRFPATVLVNRPLQKGCIGAVWADNRAGGKQATKHLIQAGHRAIGFLAGPSHAHGGRERRLGYRAALAESDLAYRPEWTLGCPPTIQGSQEKARELLTAHPELTALFCFNDVVAVGVLRACAELGRRVPDDLAVVGFDDIMLAALVTPPLTTCRVDRYDLGARAMRILLNYLDDGESDRQETVLQPKLLVRGSAP